MSVSGEQVVKAARAYLGAPFKLHGRDKKGIDCIGLILAIARDFGLAVNDIRDYDLAGINFRATERAFLDQGFGQIDPAKVAVGDIFVGVNIMAGVAGATGIVSRVGGPSLFCGISRAIHCETPTPWLLSPRMCVVEDEVGAIDLIRCQLYGVSAEVIARALRFYAYPFVPH